MAAVSAYLTYDMWRDANVIWGSRVNGGSVHAANGGKFRPARWEVIREEAPDGTVTFRGAVKAPRFSQATKHLYAVDGQSVHPLY